MQYWLLNLAVECPVWLSRLFPVVEGESLNAKPIPNRLATDYAGGLMGLFDSGMVELSTDVPGDNVESSAGIARILDRFLDASKDEPSLRRDISPRPLYERNRLPGMKVSFKLTSLGGEAWETVAEPDWSRFISVSTCGAIGDQNETGELISMDRNLILAYMGWYPEVNGEQIQLVTTTWQSHTDFNVLYWKRLPFVYHAMFQVLPAKSRWNPEPQWFRDWWASTRSWHKEPWELPSWHSE